MAKASLFIKHKALPGKRDEVRRIWEKHLRPRIAENPAQEAYFFCYDDSDPDTICVFQLYGDRTGPQEFVKASWYPAYEEEVSPLLTGESEFRSATPMWIKGAAG
ncbi:MAG: antibiotic biosynthesis monooxygenase [Rhizobiales bacterium]|nr:antibiotic biosynthesis monooxygenase [Hyphomicrobiales bacterium]